MLPDLSLIAEINHTVDQLGLLRAELARILCLKCADVSNSVHLESMLKNDVGVRKKAERFVVFYQLLEKHFPEDSVSMLHWYRKPDNKLGTSPFLAMVDEGRLEDVIITLLDSE